MKPLFLIRPTDKSYNKVVKEYEVERFPDEFGWISCDFGEYVKYDPETDERVLMRKKFKHIDQVLDLEHFYCPLCDEYFEGSEYLSEEFEDDDKVRWLANMITHYRHNHISSWDKKWGRGGYGRMNLTEETYNKEKVEVNNRAKRQITRKCSDYLIHHDIDSSVFDELMETDEKTIELVEKKVDKNKQEHEPKQ